MEQDKAALRQYLTAGVFIFIIGALFVLNLLIPPPALLLSERRQPAALPALTLDGVASGSFMSKFESYAADRFVFRDAFRTLRAAVVFGPLLQSDKSGLYFGAAGAGEFKAVDPDSTRQAAAKILKAAALAPDGHLYYAVIPDKSIYAGKYLPGYDPALERAILAETLPSLTSIPLDDCLGPGSFYTTDLHWDQSKIDAVADRLTSAMGAQAVSPVYGGVTPERAGEFRGVYAGQLALPLAADTMTYRPLPTLKAQYLGEVSLEFQEGPVYALERFGGLDPYDLFLQGPQPLILLENPAAPDRDLYLFRDSYGSSLAPLLAAAYSRITVIDLRYINAGILEQFIEFRPGADVLFLYSSQILNNPSILQA